MDITTNCEKCVEASEISENSASILCTHHVNPIEEPSMANDTNELQKISPSVELVGSDVRNDGNELNEALGSVGGIPDKKAIVIEHVILVKSSVEVEVDESTDRDCSNERSCASVSKVNAENAAIQDPLYEVLETSQMPSNMLTEEHNENNFQTCTNEEVTPNDFTIEHAESQSGTISLDAICDEKAHLTSAPALTTVKMEKDADCNQSSLALIAQYDTDNESDDDVSEVPLAQTYQNRCVEIESDSSTSDVEYLSQNRAPINLDIVDVDPDEDDDEDNTRTTRQPKVKGELQLEDLPPIEDLHITVPEEECTELGNIHSIVETLVLVKALPGTIPLDLESVLFRDKGKQVLGEIFDVLGQVSDPLYCIRFNSHKEIKEKGIEVGQTVYVAPRTEHTQFVVLANLMKVRGSDASWENDVEPPPRFIDYSDDEEERSARRPNRKRQCPEGVTYAGRGSYTPRKPYKSNFSGHGVRPHHNQTAGNFGGNSWHTNLHQTPMYNHQHYQMPNHSQGGYGSSYQQPVNAGMVINPYAIYPPPQIYQQPLFPPPFHQPPPPPPQ